MKVAGMLRRNRKITSTTRTTASPSSNSTSETEARIVVVRSVRTVTSTPAGRPAVICGSIALIESTTAMTLAPGWRCTLSRIAGVLFIQESSCVFSALSTTLATSERCTGEPFL